MSNDRNRVITDAQNLSVFHFCQYLFSLFIIAYRSHLFLRLAIYIAVVLEILFYFLWVAPKGTAERFKRVVFLIPQKHIDARHKYVWVLWQIFHNSMFY